MSSQPVDPARRLRRIVYSLLGAVPAAISIVCAWLVALYVGRQDSAAIIPPFALWFVIFGPWAGFGSLTYVIARLGEVPRGRILLNLILLLGAAAGAYWQAEVWFAVDEGGGWAAPAVLAGCVYLCVVVELGLQLLAPGSEQQPA